MSEPYTRRTFLQYAGASLGLALTSFGKEVPSEVGVYDIVERTFTSASPWQNGFLQVDVDVTFTFQKDPALRLTLPAFWNGKDARGRDRFSVRFAPTQPGEWSYRTNCRQDPSLDGLTGANQPGEVIRCTPSSNPGFLERADRYHWRYSDGTRFFPVGTTAYDWIGTPCAEGRALDYTVEFLKTHFNKVRFSYMSVRLPDNAFGGERKLTTRIENDYYWYSDLSEVDSRVINLAHWSKLDSIVRKLQQAGVHAELILARKNSLGYQIQGGWIRGIGGRPGQEGLIEDKGLRYLVGRYAAFSHLWWCVANEYPEAALTTADVNRIGETLRKLDPYPHPLSVHSYDEWLFGGQDWPTHGILQTHVQRRGLEGLNRQVTELRRRHGIVFHNDEYGYEDRERTPNDPDTVLKAHWALTLGGGYAAYGHSPTRLTGKYQWAGLDNYWEVQGKPAPPPESVAQVAEGQDAAPWLRVLRDWMNSGKVAYWRMEPSNRLVSGTAKNKFCLACEGQEYVVSGEAGTVRLGLAGAAGRHLPIAELDPKTGTTRHLGNTAGASTYELTAPSDRFLIFHVGPAQHVK